MTLNETLMKMKAAARAKLPADAVAVMATATQELNESNILDGVLATGATVPEFALKDFAGNNWNSGALLAKGPLILTFFRGSW
jgi:hypothetical protein